MFSVTFVSNPIEKAQPPGRATPKSSDPKPPGLSHDEAGSLASWFSMLPKDVPVLLVDVDGVVSLFGFYYNCPPLACPVVVDGTPHWGLSRRGTAPGATVTDVRVRVVHRVGDVRRSTCRGCWGCPADGVIWSSARAGSSRRSTRVLARRDPSRGSMTSTASARPPGAASREGPTLLVTTDPAVGITDEHVARLEAWANAA